MSNIPKKLVVDENNKPIAVQIDYSEWLALEPRISELYIPDEPSVGIEELEGTISLPVDPLEYQRMIRDEWQ